MVLTDYTTYDAVRAVLGVTNDELEDGTIGLELYAVNLKMELEDLNLLIPTEYATVAALAENARSAEQQRFYEMARLFAPYAVANQLKTALPMFGPKDISDGKATIGRFSDSPYKVTLAEVQKGYDRMKERLVAAYGVLALTSAPTVQRVLFSVSVPDSDPVVGT